MGIGQASILTGGGCSFPSTDPERRALVQICDALGLERVCLYGHAVILRTKELSNLLVLNTMVFLNASVKLTM